MPVEFATASTIFELQSEIPGRIDVRGERNTIRIGKNVKFNGLLWLQADDGLIEINDDCTIDGIIRTVYGPGSVITVGSNTTIGAAAISTHESGKITIGPDCMFSTDIHMDVSDMHPMFDRATGQRINHARNIEIGPHVWISTRVLVLKGATIEEGSIIGAGSMVAGRIPPNTLAAGTPAKVIRENIEWRRDFTETISPSTPRRRSWFAR